jgi:putative transposase
LPTVGEGARFGAFSKSAHEKPEPSHKIYPYLQCGVAITRPNQVWAMDITYIRMGRGFVDLAVVLDWSSRRVLSRRASITMEAAFCVETLQDALPRHGKPDSSTRSRAASSPAPAFTGVLIKSAIAISMDGRGAWRDNVFVERLWRRVKYEEVYLRAYEQRQRGRARGLGARRLSGRGIAGNSSLMKDRLVSQKT